MAASRLTPSSTSLATHIGHLQEERLQLQWVCFQLNWVWFQLLHLTDVVVVVSAAVPHSLSHAHMVPEVM